MDSRKRPLKNWKPCRERRVLDKLVMFDAGRTKGKAALGYLLQTRCAGHFVAVLVLVSSTGGMPKSWWMEKHNRGRLPARDDRGQGDASAENNQFAAGGVRGQGDGRVVLRINSPGGSLFQSGIIYDEIRRLRQISGSAPGMLSSRTSAPRAATTAAAADSISRCRQGQHRWLDRRN